MPVSERLASELTFSEIIIGVVFILILVAFWQKVLENLLYTTIGLNKESTYQTFIIAVALTIIFFIIINSINSIARDIILGNNQALPKVSGVFPSTETQAIVPEAESCNNNDNCCDNKNNRKNRKSCYDKINYQKRS